LTSEKQDDAVPRRQILTKCSKIKQANIRSIVG